MKLIFGFVSLVLPDSHLASPTSPCASLIFSGLFGSSSSPSSIRGQGWFSVPTTFLLWSISAKYPSWPSEQSIWPWLHWRPLPPVSPQLPKSHPRTLPPVPPPAVESSWSSICAAVSSRWYCTSPQLYFISAKPSSRNAPQSLGDSCKPHRAHCTLQRSSFAAMFISWPTWLKRLDHFERYVRCIHVSCCYHFLLHSFWKCLK